VQRLRVGLGKGFQAVMDHAPDVGEHDFRAADEIAKPFHKVQ
jgi:hypothetical protein